MRAAAMKDGAAALTALPRSTAEPRPVTCPDCHVPMESQGRRSKEIVTLFGRGAGRPHVPPCGNRRFPGVMSYTPHLPRSPSSCGEKRGAPCAGAAGRPPGIEGVAEAIGADMDRRHEAHRADSHGQVPPGEAGSCFLPCLRWHGCPGNRKRDTPVAEGDARDKPGRGGCSPGWRRIRKREKGQLHARERLGPQRPSVSVSMPRH